MTISENLDNYPPAKDEQIQITHLITGLEVGGAEMMLYKLLANTDPDQYAISVISLTSLGTLGKKISALGFPVQALRMPKGIPSPYHIIKLAKILQQQKPHILQSWMYHADLIAALVATRVKPNALIWGIHNNRIDASTCKRSTRWVAKLCARFSQRAPTKIICCAEQTRAMHEKLGYAKEKMQVIPIGFDLEQFKPNPAAYQKIRQELQLKPETQLIGLIGRFDPAKDHKNFIQAAKMIVPHHPNIHFLLCGNNITWENPQLSTMIEQTGLRSKFHLLGSRDDMPTITAALDIAALSSYSEGFPNVIGEAMACAVPCVATDVGDVTDIIGTSGYLVPPKNAQALADALARMLSLEPQARQKLGQQARQRIKQQFSIDVITNKYNALYHSLLG